MISCIITALSCHYLDQKHKNHLKNHKQNGWTEKTDTCMWQQQTFHSMHSLYIIKQAEECLSNGKLEVT